MNFSPVNWRHGRDERDRSDDAGVEDECRRRSPSRWREKISRAEIGAGFFRGFAHRFEAGHEIRDDLNHQQNRDQRSVGEQRLEVSGRAAADAQRHKDDEERERAEAGPVLKGGAEADAAIIQHREQRGQSRGR